MKYSIRQICDALSKLCVVGGDMNQIIAKLISARETIKSALSDMDDISVQGRTTIDTFLGCIMALESLVGEDDNDR